MLLMILNFFSKVYNEKIVSLKYDYVFGNIFCFRVHIKIQNKVISCSAEYFIPY